MCRAAAEAAAGIAGPRPLLFGVTVLTSFAPGEMPGIDALPADFALALARQAGPWGLDGVVCSGHEAAAIKASCPGLRCLCPGIRPAGSAAGDQRRVMAVAASARRWADSEAACSDCPICSESRAEAEASPDATPSSCPAAASMWFNSTLREEPYLGSND